MASPVKEVGEQRRPLGRLESWMPLLAVLRRYEKSWLRGDIGAGLALVTVAVPIGLAYSQLAGVPPVVGLWATILPMVVYAFLGSSRQLVVGPDSATAALVGAVVAPLASDPQQRIPLVAMLSLMVGAISIAAGVARVGFVADFLAKPVLVGYLNGVAITIVTGQLGKVLGYTASGGGFFRLAYDLLRKLDQTHWPTLAVGVAALLLLAAGRRLIPRFPMPLLVVVLGIVASRLLNLQAAGVAVTGTVPTGLPPFGFPVVPPEQMAVLAAGALGVALMSFSSGILTARSFANRGGYTLNANREFISIGAANLGAGLSQGFAISGADSRTAVVDANGGKTQVAQLVGAVGVALVLLFVTGPLAYLPTAALAAIVITAVIHLFEWETITWFRRVSRPEFRLTVITTLGVITVGMAPGVLVAAILSLIGLLARASRPSDAILGTLPGLRGHVDVAEFPQAVTIPGVLAYRFDASVVYFNAPYFSSRVRQVISSSHDLEWFVLDAEAMALIDTTGSDALEEVRRSLVAAGKTMALARARGKFLEMLVRTGFVDRLGKDYVFGTVEEAEKAFLRIDHARGQEEAGK
ncbi:SulP family inorganic anion transporter [bacterium]|nr:SulP family inorganic anion transporter [bacterium]